MATCIRRTVSRGTSQLGMGQVRNGGLYIKEQLHEKHSQRMQNAYKLHALAILDLLLNISVPLTFIKLEKTMRKNFDFVQLLSFFLQ